MEIGKAFGRVFLDTLLGSMPFPSTLALTRFIKFLIKSIAAINILNCCVFCLGYLDRVAYLYINPIWRLTRLHDLSHGQQVGDMAPFLTWPVLLKEEIDPRNAAAIWRSNDKGCLTGYVGV